MVASRSRLSAASSKVRVVDGKLERRVFHLDLGSERRARDRRGLDHPLLELSVIHFHDGRMVPAHLRDSRIERVFPRSRVRELLRIRQRPDLRRPSSNRRRIAARYVLVVSRRPFGVGQVVSLQCGFDLLRILVALGLVDLRDDRAALAARLLRCVQADEALFGEIIGRAANHEIARQPSPDCRPVSPGSQSPPVRRRPSRERSTPLRPAAHPCGAGHRRFAR